MVNMTSIGYTQNDLSNALCERRMYVRTVKNRSKDTMPEKIGDITQEATIVTIPLTYGKSSVSSIQTTHSAPPYATTIPTMLPIVEWVVDTGSSR